MNLKEIYNNTFGDPTVNQTNRNDTVLLIDGTNTYIRSFCATNTMNENGDHVGGITGFLLSIAATIRQLKPSRVIVVFDGKGGSARRRELFKDYKANRRNLTRLNRVYDFGTVDHEQESMKWQLMVLVALLRNLPLTILAPDDVEADDVLAYLAQTVQERGGNVTILSTDKDFLQLVNEHISVWHPIKKKRYTASEIVQDYGFHPNNFLMYRMVTGDKSDGIPGVDGIKEKTLLKYFPELAHDEVKTIDTLLEKTQTLLSEAKKPPVALTALSNSKDLLTRNYKLMRLDDVAIGPSTRMLILDKFEEEVGSLNKYDFQKQLVELKAITAIPNFDTWIVQSFAPLLRFKKK